MLGGLHNRVLLVISQDDHVLPFVAMVLNQVLRQVFGVVDASTQLALLAKVVDADQKGATLARAVGVLEGVILGRTVAELLEPGRRWGRGARAVLISSSSVVLLGRVPILVQMLRGRVRWRRVLPLRRRLVVVAALMLTISSSSLMLSVSSLLLSVAVLRLSVSSLLLLVPVAVLRLSVALLGRRRRMVSVALLPITLLLLRRGVLAVSSSTITLRRGLLITPSSTAVSLTRVTAAVGHFFGPMGFWELDETESLLLRKKKRERFPGCLGE